MKKFTKIITASFIVIMMLVLASLTLGSGLIAKAGAPIQLTVTGTTVDSKEYDGTLSATVKCGTLNGIIDSHAVTVTASAEFDNKNVGTDKTVYITYSLSGADADKYIAPSSTTLTADITPASLTAAGTMVAPFKLYDGNTNCNVTANGLLQGVIDGDNVEIDTATATFEDKNVGKDKQVTVTFTLKGEDAGNYTVDNEETSSEITKRDITLTSADASKKYDGTPLADSGVTTTGDGFVGEEGATFDVYGSQTNVGSSDNPFDYTLNAGTTAGNYSITTIWGTLTVTPCDTEITIIANSASKTVDGTALADNGYTYTGTLLPGHYFDSVTVTGSITDVGSTNNMVTGFVIKNQAGDDVTNFYSNISTLDGTLTIEPEQAPATGDVAFVYVVLAVVTLASVAFVYRKKTNN